MATRSVQLDSFGIGATQLDMHRMQPHHRKSVEDSLSTNFFSQPAVGEYFNKYGPNINFNFNIERDYTAVTINGVRKEFRSPELPEGAQATLWKIDRISKFYQHTGKLPGEAPLPEPQQQEVERLTEKTVIDMKEAAKPGWTGASLAVTNVGETSLSFARNVLQSIPEFGPSHTLVHNLALPVGAVWAGFSLRECYTGYGDHKRAEAIGDKEGLARAKAQIAGGALSLAGSVAFVSGKAAVLAGGAVAAAGALSIAADTAFGLGSLIGIGLASVGILRCYNFQQRLNDYYDEKELPDGTKLDEETRLKGTLKFLEGLLSISKKERSAIVDEVNLKFPHMTQGEKDHEVEKRLNDLIEKKIKYLKRRTSSKSLERIVNEVPNLLKQLALKDTDPAAYAEGVKATHDLIQFVRRESYWKTFFYTLGVFASVVSLVGTILANIVTFGTYPFIMLTIASAVYLLIAGYMAFMALWRQDPHQIAGINSHMQMPPMNLVTG